MEAMTIEEISSDWLKLCRKYQFCETRIPILRKIKNQKSNSDVDFFGWKVSNGKDGYDICFGEVKVRGTPKNVIVYIDKDDHKNFLDWLDDWGKSYQNIKAFFQKDGDGFFLNKRLHKYLGFGPDKVNNINIVFVGNIWIKDINNDEKLLENIEQEFANSIHEIYKDDLPDSLKITSTIRPTFCVISDLVKYCKNDINNGYKKRYGHMFFDIIREINRYQNPKVLRTTQKYAKPVKKEIEEYTKEEIFKMFE